MAMFKPMSISRKSNPHTSKPHSSGVPKNCFHTRLRLVVVCRYRRRRPHRRRRLWLPPSSSVEAAGHAASADRAAYLERQLRAHEATPEMKELKLEFKSW